MQAIKDSTRVRIDGNFEMPVVPVVLFKILQSVDDNSASARRLEDLILHDLSLSVRILKLANSAFYSFRSEVKTISHAIALLGLNLVRSLAIGVSIFESFTKELREEEAYVSQLWMHSFAVGLIAQEIWGKRSSPAEAEFALLCGLLHDVGKVIYFQKDGVRYSRLFAMGTGDDDPGIRTRELKVYEVDHACLGALLAKQCNLPSDLATIIRLHHDNDAGGIPLVAAVSLGDMIVKQAGIGYDGDRKITADLRGLQELLKMGQGESDALRFLAESKRADVEEFFQLTA
jgi:putative nucleotidyltransferase with HDIG domain